MNSNLLFFPKALYFTLNLAVYASYAFLANYLADVWKFPIHNYAYMSSLAAVSFGGSLFWSLLADRTSRHKIIIIFASCSYALLFCLLRSGWFVHLTGWKRALFIVLVYGGSDFFISALYPLIDNYVFSLLSSNKGTFSSEMFGRQRLWGTIGQGAVTILNGFGIKLIGYDAIFISLILSATTLVFLVIFGVPKNFQAKTEREETSQEKKFSFITPCFKLICSFEFTFIMTICLFAGFSRAIVGNFLNYYLKNVLNQDPSLFSIASQTRIVTEIFFFFIGKQLVHHFGPRAILLFGFVCGISRSGLYGFLPTKSDWPALIILIELLKGINNACVISAGARLANDLAPNGCSATAQGFFSGVHSNLANGFAGLCGGLVLQVYQADPFSVRKLFQISTGITFAGFILFICIIFLLRTLERNRNSIDV